MKKITFPSFFLFLAMIQNAQVLQVKVNWGEKYSVRDFGKYINQKPIGHTDNYIFIRHKYKKNKELVQYDFENKIIKKTPLDFRFKGDEVFIYNDYQYCLL